MHNEAVKATETAGKNTEKDRDDTNEEMGKLRKMEARRTDPNICGGAGK